MPQWLHWYGLSPVCLLMCYKMTSMGEPHATLTALIWAFPSVDHKMWYKFTIH